MRRRGDDDVVYWAVGAIAVFYFLNLPFRFAVALDIGEKNQIRIGVGMFSANFFYRRAIPVTMDALIGARKAHRAQEGPRRPAPVRAILGALKALMRHADFSNLRCQLIFGTGDAARTAMLYGAATALLNALGTILRQSDGFHARVRPDFERRGLHLSAGGMVTLKTGHIMLAGLKLLRAVIQNRDSEGKTWSSIPLKTS